MVNAPTSESSRKGLNHAQGHCVVFLGKMLHSHSADLHAPGEMDK